MATKTLRVTLADILGVAGPVGRVKGEVWARFVDGTGQPRDIRYTDGTVVVMAAPRQELNASGYVDFVVVPNDDATVQSADQGFGIQVGWDLTARGEHGSRQTITNPGKTVAITSASPSIAQYGLLATYVPIIAGTSYITQSTADAAYAPTGAGGLGIQVADGANTATLNSALSSAATFGAVVLIGNHTLSASLSVPTGATLRGRNNDSRLVLPTSANYPAIDIDGKTDVKIERLRITRAGALAAGGTAVRVRGACNRIDITDVRAEQMYDGFRIVGGEGSTPGTINRVNLTRCRAITSDEFGFWFDDVYGVDMTDCTSNVSGLDGIKLRKKAQNVTITGGWFTGATGGDGLDAYAGGETFTVQGASFSGNTLNGVTIKCDDLSKSDPTTYGLPRNITLTGLRCDGNGGNGLAIHRNGSTDDTTEPLVTRVAVAGGTYNGNTGHGIFLRARQLSLTGVLAANNQGNGIRIEPTAFDVTLVAPQCAGNGRRDSVTDGISVAGQRVQIFGGTSIGSDPDGATSDADLSAGTKYQRYGLRLESTATGALVVGLTLKYNVTAPLSNSTADAFFINATGTDTADSMYLPNNRKVQAYKTDGTLTDLIYLNSSNALKIGKSDQASMDLLAAVINTFAKVQMQAGTTSAASLRIQHGVAPTSPQDGDMWSTTAGLFIRINGVTKTVTLT